MKRRTFLKHCGSVGLFTLITPTGFVHAIGPTTASRLEEGFKRPPSSAFPQTWWHWMNGNVTKEGITLDLEAMKEIGVGGFQNFDAGTLIPKGPVVYLSPEWVELKKHTILEAERLGLEFTMHNCPGWSSSGGPWITPELAMKQLTWSEAYVTGSKQDVITLPQPTNKLNFYRDICVLAYPSLPGETSLAPSSQPATKNNGADRLSNWKTKANFEGGFWRNKPLAEPIKDLSKEVIIDPSTVLDITKYLDSKGHLNWTAPAGAWTILRIGYTPIGSLNHSAPDTGVGLECDKYSRRAIDFHFNKMMENLLPALAPLTQKGKVGLLIDSYEVGMQNWTDGFEKEFHKRKGYSLLNYLPAMTGRVVGSVETAERFLWDVRRTQADLIADNYYGRFAELCKQHGIISYTEPYEGGPMEELQIGSRVETNMGEFWNGLSSIFQNNYTMRRTTKLAASIAHINGQEVVGAEAFTSEPASAKWQEYPFAMKALGDKMYTQGLNRVIFHRFAHQPHPTALPGMTMGPWGIHFDRTNTWWKPGKAWMQYMARVQHLLQQGLFVADLLYFTGEEVATFTKVHPEQLTPAPPAGYDYDLINTETLLKRAKVQSGRIVLPDGIS